MAALTATSPGEARNAACPRGTDLRAAPADHPVRNRPNEGAADSPASGRAFGDMCGGTADHDDLP
jgi:hypothetical protein